MKRKYLILAAVILMPAWLNGQNLDDALRYSQQFQQGTARFNGMGGAFTALGGDLSAININPAATAVFRSSEFSFSPQLTFKDITTSFRGTSFSTTGSYFGLGQIGIVFAAKSGKGSGLTGMNFAYTYNKTNNLNKYSTINGVCNASSIADYFASLGDGNYTWELSGNTSLGYMGYYTYLTDTVSGSFTDYSSVFSFYDEEDYIYGQEVTRVIDNSGNTGEHTFAAGINLGDKVYIGGSLGMATISYTGHYQHSEADYDEYNPWFSNLSFTDHFDADGIGLNFKAGLIFKPVESLRLGLSIQTPTVYWMSEVYYSSLTASYDVDMNGSDIGGFDFDIQKDPMSYAYTIRTPYRINAGAALQLGTMALLSADYEFVDYANAKLGNGEDGYEFDAENDDLRNEFRSAHNLRMGAEVRLGTLYLRGGYRYYGSAFKEGTLNEEWSYSMYSAGLGYRQKSFFFDLSMSFLASDEVYKMYPDAWLDETYANNLDKILTATVGLKF